MSVWDKERKKTTLLPRLQWGAQPLYELIRGCQYELTYRANLLSGVVLVPLFLSFFFLLCFPLCPSTDFSCSRHFSKKTGRGNGPDHRLSTNRLSRTWHFTTVSVGHFTITKKTRFVFNLYFNLVISTRLP